MPPVVAAAAAVGSAFLATSTWFASLTVAAQIAVQLGIAVVGSVAATKLAGKPKGVADRGPAARNVTARGTLEPRRLAIGRPPPFAGHLVYFNVSGSRSQFLWYVIRWVDHEIDAFEGFWIDDVFVPVADIGGDGLVSTSAFVNSAGKKLLRIRNYRGNQTTVDSELNAEFSEITSSFVGNTVAYSVFRFELDDSDGPTDGSPKVWANGPPQTILVQLRGARMHDPRVGSTSWTRNPALAWRYLLVGWTYGPQFSNTNVPSAFVSEAANICDETVTVWNDSGSGTTTQPRYTCDGLLTTEDHYDEQLDQICSAMFGRWFCQAGKFIARAGAYYAPEWTLTEDDLGSGDLEAVLMNGPDSGVDSGRCNKVTGSYWDAARQGQKVEFLPRSNSTYLSEDAGHELVRDIDLPFTADEQTAQRIALLHLKTSRRQQVLTVRTKGGALPWGLTDVVSVTIDALGYSNHSFQVVETGVAATITDGEGAAAIYTLREINADDFEYIAPPAGNSELDPPGSSPTVSNQATRPPPPTGLTVTPVSNGVKLAWTNPSMAEVLHIEVLRSNTSGGSGETVVAKVDSNYWVDELKKGTERFYRIRSRGRNGAVSTFEPSNGRISSTSLGYFLVQDPDEIPGPVSADYIQLPIKAGDGPIQLDASVTITFEGTTSRLGDAHLAVVEFIPPSTTITILTVFRHNWQWTSDDPITMNLRNVCEHTPGERDVIYSIRAGGAYRPGVPQTGLTFKISNQALAAVVS